MAHRTPPTDDPYFLKKPKFDSYESVVEYQAKMIQAQHKGAVTIERHRVINGSCQIVLKAKELEGNIAEIMALEKRMSKLENNGGKKDKKNKQKKGMPDPDKE